MTSSRFIFNEWCIKDALINTGEFSAGEFTSGEFDEGGFSVGEFDEGGFSAGSSPSTVFSYLGKRLHQKAKFRLKTYDVTDWITHNYNTHISQYLTKQRQSFNEIWSVRIQHEKYFSAKIMQKMMQGD